MASSVELSSGAFLVDQGKELSQAEHKQQGLASIGNSKEVYNLALKSLSAAATAPESKPEFIPRVISISERVAPLWIEGKIAPDLYEICKIINNNSTDNLPDQSDRRGWNVWMQKHLLRPKGLDHQDLINWNNHPEHEKLFNLFKKLNLVEAIAPSRKFYDTVVIFGGTPWDSRERMGYVDNLWKSEAIKTNKVVYINGKRLLRDEEKNPEDLFNLSQEHFANRKGWKAPSTTPEYQHEEASIVWDQLIEDPILRGRFEVLTIEPTIDSLTGKVKRAVTEDTVKAFFKSFPDTESCLFVSNNPYGPYQAEIIQTILNKLKESGELPKVREVDSVASKLLRDCATIVFTDTLARRFYTQIM